MIVLLILLGLLLTAYVLLRLLMRGRREEHTVIEIDGATVPVTYRFGSKLPKALHAGGTTINETVCFRGYPRRYGLTVVGVGNVTRRLGAHELGHVIDKHRKGFVRYWSAALWQIILIRQHDDRPFEQQADAYMSQLLTGTCTGVNVGMALETFN